MATEEECLAALDRLVARLSEVNPEEFARRAVERTVSCEIPDLGLLFRTRIHPGGLDAFERDTGAVAGSGTAGAGDGRGDNGVPREPAQVRLRIGSDDLVALAGDELHVGKAWASGRLTIDASVGDLLRITRLLTMTGRG
jgi:hypothetical protein